MKKENEIEKVRVPKYLYISTDLPIFKVYLPEKVNVECWLHESFDPNIQIYHVVYRRVSKNFYILDEFPDHVIVVNPNGPAGIIDNINKQNGPCEPKRERI